MMRPWQKIIACVSVGAAILAASLLHARAGEPTAITPPDDRKDPEKVAAALWSGCLREGRQVVLYPDKWSCTDLADGASQLLGLDPILFDRNACTNPTDMRRMPTGILQALKIFYDPSFKSDDPKLKAKDSDAPEIRKNGIRVIGGLFCQDELNLNDFELPVSLVLDRGVFRYGVRATKMKIAGNLSFDRAYIYDNLAISDSTINGTLFGNGSFIQQTRIIDTAILDNLRLNRGLLLDYVNLIHVKVGRGIRLDGSKLSSLNIRQGQIIERLNLNATEAACKYVIESPDIAELWADGTGFGKTVADPSPPENTNSPSADEALKGPSSAFRGWRSEPAYPEMLHMPSIQALIKKSAKCDDTEAQFSISGGSIRSICMRDFKWSTPGENLALAPTTVSFNRLTVGDSMMLNLWRKKATVPKPVHNSDRTLSMVNTKIATLFFDFKDNDRPYQTAIDRLTIDRIYSTERVNVAEKANTVDKPKPNRAKAAGTGCSARPNEAERQLPNSSLVSKWLEKNTAGSLQPYLAFIKAFDNAGADTTDLKIAKAKFEFEQNYDDYWNSLSDKWHNRESLAAFIGAEGWHFLVDHLAFGSRWLLGKFVDYGFRPAQVIWVVALIVLVSWVLFWWPIKIIAFSPPDSDTIFPIGPIFVFDRLLPLYKLRDENSKIGTFYTRGSGAGAKTVHRFRTDVKCVPATPGWARVARGYLDFLKVLGVILAAFLIAAINALIAR
jgi:hypothetical protein